MVKAIFFDIDGTLVSFKTHKIPASTQEALKALRDKSIKTVSYTHLDVYKRQVVC